MTRRFTLAALLMVCVVLGVSLAQAAEDILKLVPEKASGFVVVNKPAALDAKILALAGKMQLPAPSPLMILKMSLRIEGVDERGTVALVVLPPASEGALPTPILFVPVTDYDKFLAPFEPEERVDDHVTRIDVKFGPSFAAPGWVRKIGGYAAITDEANREALTKSIALASNVPAGLAPWQKWLENKDVAGVLLAPGLKRLSDKVKQQLELWKKSMVAMSNASDPMGNMAQVFGVYATLLEAAEKEVSTVGFGLELDETKGVCLAKRVMLVPDGKWSQMLSQISPAKVPLLKGLPEGPFVVAGGAVISDAMWDSLMQFSTGFMGAMREIYGMNEEQTKRMSKMSVQAFRGVRSMSVVLGAVNDDESIYANSVSVMRVQDSKAFLGAYEKWAKEYAELLKEIKSPMLQPVDVQKDEVGGTAALKFSVKMPQQPANMAVPSADKMMKDFFGPEGKLTGWTVPADEHSVVLGYVSKERMQQLIAAIKQGKAGLAGDADVAKTTALLPADLLAVGYVSPRGTLNLVKRVMMTAAEQKAKNLPEFPQTPPIGFAMTSAPNEMEARLVVPVEVLQAVGQCVMKVQTSRP